MLAAFADDKPLLVAPIAADPGSADIHLHAAERVARAGRNFPADQE